MSSKITIPKKARTSTQYNNNTGGGGDSRLPSGARPEGLTASTYCYIKADEDHHDLQDLFGGKYLKAQEIWRFDKKLEQTVYNFLDCSSSESESEGDDNNRSSLDKFNSSVDESIIGVMDQTENEIIIKASKSAKTKRRDRLHRANSFNASDESNDECDSLDENFRRHCQSIEKISKESDNLKKEAQNY